MKNKLILFLKGLLLYVTVLFILLFISGIDSIYEQGYFVEATILITFLVIICINTINDKELDILTFNKYFKEPKENIK
jgi:uncharacterized membrane protein YiaA